MRAKLDEYITNRNTSRRVLFISLWLFFLFFSTGCDKPENQAKTIEAQEDERASESATLKVKSNISLAQANTNQITVNNDNPTENSASLSFVEERVEMLLNNVERDNPNDLADALATSFIESEEVAKGIASKLAKTLSEQELFNLSKKCGRNFNYVLKYWLLEELFKKCTSQDLKDDCTFQLVLTSKDAKKYHDTVRWSNYVLSHYSEDSWLHTPAVLSLADASVELGDYETAIDNYKKDLKRLYQASVARRLAETYIKAGKKEEALQTIDRAIEIGNPNRFELSLLNDLKAEIKNGK